MLMPILVLLFGMIGRFCSWMQEKVDKTSRKNDERGWGALGGVFSFFAYATILISFFVFADGYAKQISDFEDTTRLQNVKKIYENKAKALTAEFATHLGKVYPEHEKEIFKNIGPEKVAFYVVKYPELKASETLIKLVEQINKLQSDVYDQEIQIEQLRKNTRERQRNPWYFKFLIPAS